MKREHIPIISYVVLVIAIMFGIEQDNGFVIGDFLLSKVGLPLWSEGTEGLHYSGLISIFLVMVSFIGFSVFSKEASPSLKKVALITFLFGHLLFRPLFNESYALIKGSMDGLAPIDFYRSQSHSSFESTADNKFIVIESKLTFENYSNEEKMFYIKLLPTKFDLTEDSQVIATDKTTKNIKEFTLAPKSTNTFDVTFFSKQKKNVSDATGGFTSADIIIYNAEDEVQFIQGTY